jgi:hypothetical protein
MVKMQRLFPNKTKSRVIRLFVGLAILLSAISVVTLTQPANAVLSSLPTFVNADLTAGVEVAPYVYDYKAADSQTTTHLLTTFEGTADYTVNGGTPISLTSGTQSPVINLGSGDSISDRVTKIVLTHRNNGNTVYTLRIFRLGHATNFEFRDKNNTSNSYASTETIVNDFERTRTINVPHSMTTLDFRMQGPGLIQYWNGYGPVPDTNWISVNWEGCCPLRDGENINPTGAFTYFPFRDNAVLDGIGTGPTLTYNFVVNREYAYGSSIMTSVEFPELNTTCSQSPTSCPEVSPGYFDIRAADSQRTIRLDPVFATGTATYSVNGGSPISLTSGTRSGVISLNAGDSLANRVTKIDVVHTGALTTTYHYRIFRLGHATNFEFRDKNNTSNSYASTETIVNDFERTRTINVPHSMTTLDFRMQGPGLIQYWNGYGPVPDTNWISVNWEGCCPLRDGENINPTGAFTYFPFRDNAVLDGIGTGPTLTYNFVVNREYAYGSSIMTSVEFPELNTTCSQSPTSCPEVSPGYFDIRAADSQRTIRLDPVFATGTATYSVNGGSPISLTSGTRSGVISLNAGDSLANRVTKIDVVHTGALTTTYHYRIFRLGHATNFEFRDKNNTSNSYASTETIVNDFERTRTINVPHSMTTLDFRMQGPGLIQYWNGYGPVPDTNWISVNWEGCCPLRDGENINPTGAFTYFPFRDNAVLDGIGTGPTLTYNFVVNRAYAFGQGPTTTSTTTTTTTTVPTGTTTTEPSTTTTTVVSGGGSGSGGGNGSGGSSDSTVTTVAQGQNDIVTIAPSSSTTVASVSQAAVSTTSSSTSTSTTTLPPDVVARGAATTPAPTVAEIALGAAAMTIDGKEVKVNITRVNNQIVVSGAGVTMTMSVVSVNNERVPLDSIGGLRFGSGDRVVMQAVGLAPGEEVTLWAFSTPTSLGTVKADANGKIAGTFKMPSTLEKGDHRLVLQGLNSDGKKIVLGVGVGVGQVEKSSSLSRILIAVPIALAVFFGVVLPTQARRRRRRRRIAAA